MKRSRIILNFSLFPLSFDITRVYRNDKTAVLAIKRTFTLKSNIFFWTITFSTYRFLCIKTFLKLRELLFTFKLEKYERHRIRQQQRKHIYNVFCNIKKKWNMQLYSTNNKYRKIQFSDTIFKIFKQIFFGFLWISIVYYFLFFPKK